jgi:predicted nucleotidyltransferase
MSTQTVIEALPAILAEFPEISLVYLFGSQVSGQTGPMSDYDVAILDDAEPESSIQTRFQHTLVKALHIERVDVIVLRRAPIELAYHVIADGKLLYQRDTLTRVEFEADVLGRYGDYLPVLRSQQKQILEGDTNAIRIQRYRAALGRTQRALGSTRTP